MATALKLRRGTTSQHSTFTGAEGEVTVDTTKDTVVVHDGSTAGGFPLARENGANTFTANQVISVTDNTNAALRVTQLGTGDALLVEDEANPDSTPFVVKADGKVGIGTASPANALEVSSSETFEKLNSSTSGYSVFYQATNPQGSFYAGKDRDGSAGLWGSGGEYVIAGTGNYPMDFWTNGTKRLSITGGGNLNFAGTGQRITGDMSNATNFNRLLFQTSTVNGISNVGVMPNGTSLSAGFQIYNNSDPDNASTMIINSNLAGTYLNIASTRTGTGTSLPIQILIGSIPRARFETNGDFQFNSGYGSAATAYGCRAWVNFDGTAASNLTGTYSQTGTTVTVTITGHGYVTGNSAYLDFTSGTAADGSYEVTVVDANTFTVTQASRTTSGNVTDRRNTIRASGNVSSVADNGAGNYTVNFTTAMPDANYSVASHVAIGSSSTTTKTIATMDGDIWSTTQIQVRTGSGSSYADAPIASIAIFR